MTPRSHLSHVLLWILSTPNKPALIPWQRATVEKCVIQCVTDAYFENETSKCIGFVIFSTYIYKEILFDILRTNFFSHCIYCSCCLHTVLSFFWRDSPHEARASSFTRFLDHTQRRSTVSRTPLDELSARRRDLYQSTQNTHNRQTDMPPVGFEHTISAGERRQT